MKTEEEQIKAREMRKERYMKREDLVKARERRRETEE